MLARSVPRLKEQFMIKHKFHLLFLATVVLGGLPAMAQPGPPPPLPGGGVLEPFGGGFSPERQLHIKVKNGPFEVVTGKFTLPGGGEIDWHDHPGTGVLTVSKGAFDEFRENGCVVLHGPGSVFFENQGEIHRVANASASEPAEALITFFLPVGSAFPVTFVGPPKDRPCTPRNGKEPNEGERPSLEEIQAKIDANADAVQTIHDLLNSLIRSLPFRR